MEAISLMVDFFLNVKLWLYGVLWCVANYNIQINPLYILAYFSAGSKTGGHRAQQAGVHEGIASENTTTLLEHVIIVGSPQNQICLLYTSDAADE